MSILIKGMEMPKSCDDCPFGDAVRCNLMPGVPAWWAEYDKCVKEKRLHIHCPLVPVPPHGRLIDADALAKKMRGIVFRGEEKDVLHHNVQAFLDAPTIIPASEEGE